MKRKVLFRKFRIHPFQKKPFFLSTQKEEDRGVRNIKGAFSKKVEEWNRWNSKQNKKNLKTDRIQKSINELLIEGGKKEKGKKRGWIEVEEEKGEEGRSKVEEGRKGRSEERRWEDEKRKEDEGRIVINNISISEYLLNIESLKNKIMDFEEVESFESIYPVKEGERPSKNEKKNSSISIFKINTRKISEDQYFFIQKKLKSEANIKNKPRRSVSLDSNHRNMLLDRIEEKSKENISEKEMRSCKNADKKKNKLGLEEKKEKRQEHQEAEKEKRKKTWKGWY